MVARWFYQDRDGDDEIFAMMVGLVWPVWLIVMPIFWFITTERLLPKPKGSEPKTRKETQ